MFFTTRTLWRTKELSRKILFWLTPGNLSIMGGGQVVTFRKKSNNMIGIKTTWTEALFRRSRILDHIIKLKLRSTSNSSAVAAKWSSSPSQEDNFSPITLLLSGCYFLSVITFGMKVNELKKRRTTVREKRNFSHFPRTRA